METLQIDKKEMEKIKKEIRKKIRKKEPWEVKEEEGMKKFNLRRRDYDLIWQIRIPKTRLQRAGYKFKHRRDQEGAWRLVPPYIRVRVNPWEKEVIYCFDFPNLEGVIIVHYWHEYYDGDDAVKAALQLWPKGAREKHLDKYERIQQFEKFFEKALDEIADEKYKINPQIF
jgi:hypothetical protein